MCNNKLNDKDLENINGGITLALNDTPTSNLAPKYQEQQKVRFLNPNDTSVELIGLIRAVGTEPGADGLPFYIILVSASEQEAALMIGRNYRVSEQGILGVVA